LKKIKLFVFCGLALTVILGYFFVKFPKSNIVHPPLLVNQHPISRDQSKRRVASDNDRLARRKDSIIVKVKEDATADERVALSDLLKKADLQTDRKLLNGKAVLLHVHNSQYQDNEEEMANQLMATGAVEFAEPDYFLPPAMIPNDPMYVYEWHHPQIRSDLAWDVTQGSSNVLVAVCDSGFDLTHPEIASIFSLPGYNTVTNNSAIDSINSHGTMTTGVLAAIGNNSQAIAGMAWGIRVLPIQISTQSDGSATVSDIGECITYATNHGVKVVNISYDGVYSSSLLSSAAQSLRTAGGLAVAGAGNSALDLSSWGASPQFIIVGSSDQQDKLSSFSNFGKPVDIVAPGENIYSVYPGGGISVSSGTSFSTPLVSGTAALLYSLNPALTPSQVEYYILVNAQNVGLFAGRLNAGATLQMAAQDLSGKGAPLFFDNLPAGQTDATRSFKGKWCDSSLIGWFDNPSISNCGSRTDSYRFTPNITKSGNYGISIRYMSSTSFSSQADVQVRTSSGTTKKPVNMQTGGGTWVSLGTYSLKAGTGNYIEISNAAGPVNVDGIRIDPM
jgi:subtilisin family serine protease